MSGPGAQAPAEPARRPAPPASAHKPLEGAELALGTVTLSLAMFMTVLDSSIANVSISAIAGDVGVSISQGTWVITSYGVANAISLPLTGWLTQRLGQVRLFVASVVLFVFASFLCGMSPSIEWLIGFRVLQGAVAGPMIPLSQTLLLSSYPPAKAGVALATWSMTTLLAPMAGPLLGGWITDNMSWPWIFFINVPVGLLAAAFAIVIYRRRETPTRRLPVDTVGLALLVIWVGSFQVLLDKGKELDWFGSSTIVVLAIVSAISFAVFLVWELTEEHPVVDLSLFGRRNFAFGVSALAIAYALFFGNVVIVPLWLQQTMGYSATMAGITLAPVGLLALLLTPLAGRKIGVWDKRAMTMFSFLSFAVVMGLRSTFTTQADLPTIMLPTILQGIPIAFFFIPLMSLILADLPPDRMPSASGLSNFVRMSAGSFGTSVATTVWEERGSMHHAHLSEAIAHGSDATTQAIATMQAAGLTQPQALESLNRMVTQQAMTMSANDIYMASSCIFVVLAGYIWLAKGPSVGR